MLEFLVDHLFLAAIAALSGAMLLWSFVGRRLAGVREAGTLEAVQLINRRDALVLDVRDQPEYAGGHIPGARHIPLPGLEKRLGELEKLKERPIVVNCGTGDRAATAYGILVKNGFKDVYSLKGGIIAWQQAGLPTEK